MSVKELNIDGHFKKTIDVDYNDVVWLCKKFFEINGYYPSGNMFCSKNNLPSQKIVTNILKNNNISYSDFWKDVGKTSHVRSEKQYYDLYLNRFKKICLEQKILTMEDLCCNSFGLPSPKWFIQNCPDKTVKTYNDFIKWCGFKPYRVPYDKQFVAKKLIEYENKVNHPLTRDDITINTVGFSIIVVIRLWGSFSNCKKEIGLKVKQRVGKKFSFIELKEKIDFILYKIKTIENRTQITFKHDISKTPYLDEPVSYYTYYTHFQKHGINLREYIEDKGFSIARNGNGICYNFTDGEKTKSLLEYKFSLFLRNDLNLKYNKDYYRDVKYQTFSDTNRLIDCDYVINYNGRIFYIEITGMIKSQFKNNWMNIDFKSKGKNKYRDNLLIKKELFELNDLEYYFLFSIDIENESYKQIFNK